MAPGAANRSTRLLAPLLLFLAAVVLRLPALSVGLGGAGTAQVLSAGGFGAKMQLGGGGSLRLGIPILAWLDLEVDLGILGVAASDPSGGFAYRGLCGGNLGASAVASASVGSWERVGRLRAGGGLGVAATVARYEYTTLYFFYPELRAEGFVEFSPVFLPSLGMRLSLPVSVPLRKDVDCAAAVGLGLAASYRFGAAR